MTEDPRKTAAAITESHATSTVGSTQAAEVNAIRVAKAVLVLHGPNLNLLGEREPAIYGNTSLADLDAMIVARGESLGLRVETFQSNHEGALIDRLHTARGLFDGVIFNPGGYTHSSVALHDAIRAVGLLVIEVHLSNTAAREAFRHRSITGAACVGRIEGFGPDSYVMALEQLARIFSRQPR
jgi:3-dehydroquinate dehydratase-2